jgi:hypothetical protein
VPEPRCLTSTPAGNSRVIAREGAAAAASEASFDEHLAECIALHKERLNSYALRTEPGRARCRRI